jgi:hypothetical protein
MGAGIPGTGMATLFYVVCAFVMPLRELVLTVQGRSSWARWRLVCRHLLIALAMASAAVATFRFLPRAVLPPDATLGGVSSLVVTVVLFFAYLLVANVLALLVPRRLPPVPQVLDLRDVPDPLLPPAPALVSIPTRLPPTEVDLERTVDLEPAEGGPARV